MSDGDRRRGLVRVIASAVLGLVVLPVATNRATGGDAPWWAILSVLVVGALVTWLTVVQYLAQGRVPATGEFPAEFRRRALRRARAVLDARLAYRPTTWARLDLVDASDRIRAPDDLTVTDERRSPPGRVPAVFDESGRSLLLLGAPGAGKTTQLLDLADRLLTDAESGAEQPIPVVVDLSSFRPAAPVGLWPRQRALASSDRERDTRWLLRSLRREYGLGRQVAERWLAAHQLVLLLDGLDEVPRVHRAACLRWINFLQRRYRVPPMVVCSREREYADAGEELAMQGAVLIAPLPRERVMAWLGEGGAGLDHVRQAIEDDPTLLDLLDAPLWLDVLAAVSRPSRQVRRGRTLARRRRALLDAYVDEAIRRGDQSAGYTRGDVDRWLGLLGRPAASVVASRRRFGLVALDARLPDDAVPPVKAWIAAPVTVLVTAAGAAVLWWHAGAGAAVSGAAAAVLAVLPWRMARAMVEDDSGDSGNGREDRAPGRTMIRPRPGRFAALAAVVTLAATGLAVVALGLAEALAALVGLLPRVPSDAHFWPIGRWIVFLAAVLIAAFCFGLVMAAIATVRSRHSVRTSGHWLSRFLLAALVDTLIGLVACAAAIYVLGLAYLFLSSIPDRYLFTGTIALSFFAAGGAVGFMTDTMAGGRSGFNSPQEYWVSLVGVEAIAAGFALVFAYRHGWVSQALLFHLVAVGVGGGAGLFLAAQIRWWSGRSGALTALCLSSVGYLPWRLGRFLDYAARRDLLRREGPDYRFRHQLFAEHFAPSDQ
ncbi:hypothetical protein [Actinomadura nitritigenes]|uniref:hypothetical protein n=1 Tax=Actinomadura nitritigenes TaxID=134602 RepID=UPI003D94A793